MTDVRPAWEKLPLLGPRLLLVCNLLLAGLAFAAVWRYDRDRVEERFLRLVDRTNVNVQTDMDLTVALLRGVLGLFQASDHVEHREFDRYVAALRVRETHPGLLGLGYAAQVGPDEVESLEASVRADGEPGYRVWPLPTRPDDAAIVYLEPPDRGNVLAHGYTMTSEPTRRRAMERARDSGEGVASDAVTLVQEEGIKLPGFLIYFPFYASGAPIDTVEQRRAALRGYVYAPLRARDIFTAANGVPRELGVRASQGPRAGGGDVIYEDTAGIAAEALTAERQLRVGGKTWTVLYFDREPQSAWWRSPAWGVLAAGMLFAGLVYRVQVLQVRGRVRAELDAAALREERGRYRFLADAMPQLVFIADRTGRLGYVNGRWESDGLGQPLAVGLLQHVHVEDRAEAVRSWESALASGAEWSATFRLRAPGSTEWRWHLGRALPQRDGAGVREWVGTLTDIEAQKVAEGALARQAGELERRVEERTAELERSVRELENFAAVASHDLQEPLRKIVAFGDRLADALGADLPPPAADALMRMRRSAQRLQQLISDLLTFARISRAEVIATPIDLGAIVREAREELLEGRTDGAVVEVEELPLACGDPGLIRQFVVNLLENALKFHRPGEPPRVRIFAEEAGDEIPPEERAGWFRFLVQDEGIGFDPKYVQRIFQVFQRLHPVGRYEGTGIGLAICQRVVELHGGHITARASPSAGACFVSTLPRAAPGTREGGCAV